MGLLTRAWQWFEDRTGISKLMGPFLRHPVPPGTDTLKYGWWYVFGVATLAAFALQVVTGIALATAYVPSTAHAYDTLKFISDDARFGRVLRGMHYFGASAMMIMIGAHMIRVVLTGSYKFPREMNWLTGVVLFLLTVAMAFTGQLLRWDNDAIGSVLIAAEQAGRVPFVGQTLARLILAGETVGGVTLSRFFAFHVFFFPALIFAVVGFHLYLVLHNGISEPPKAGRPVDPSSYRAWYHQLVTRYGRRYFPDAAWREIAFAVGVIAVVALLALVVGPKPLGEPPDPTAVNVYPRPDWYFLWLYALLSVIPYGLENYVIVLGPLVAGVALVLLPFVANRGERSPARRPWAVAGVTVAVLMVASLWMAGRSAPWSPVFNTQPLTAQQIGNPSDQALAGAKLFSERGCQSCHGVKDQGGSRGPNLTDVAVRLPPQEIAARIMIGPGNMPSYSGTLNSDELNDLVAFLQALSADQHTTSAR
jgi:ubiquinol-cytochrome c reductase cytochrome b subunit